MRPSAARRRDWTHSLACLLVAVTALLLGFGALVTTYEAAMAVPDWPATYGHNMLLFPWSQWLGGPWDLFLEHGHRLLGAVVGLLSLVLAGVAWRGGHAAPVKWLAIAAVALVIVQGLLGGARVLLDDKTVAKVHACTGPLFFSVAIAIATLTRRGLRSEPARAAIIPPPGPRAVAAVAGSATLVVASYVQLVAGAQLRHLDAAVDPSTFRWLVGLHLAGAAVVAAVTAVLAGVNAAVPSPARRWSWAIASLVLIQLALGCGAWVVSWGIPAGLLPGSWELAHATTARSATSAAVVTGHVLLGMAILGAAVALAIESGVFGARECGWPRGAAAVRRAHA